MTHNFYPGPSTLHPYFEESIKSAITSGILSMNHRSSAFASLYQDCIEVLQEKWRVPKNYKLLFVSSATETWQIIAQSLIVNERSLHVFNGAFGKKSFDATQKLTLKASPYEFSYDKPIEVNNLKDYPFINICQNETSNGTFVSDKTLSNIRSKFPDSILSVDVTSSLGGSNFNFNNADIWYSSVQKCLGLPSGMGVILINEKAIDVAKNKNIKLHYNDLSNLIINAEKHQTTHTPNILSIHSLQYTQNKTDSIDKIDSLIKDRKKHLLESLPSYNLLSKNDNITSSTVLAFECNQPTKIISEAFKNDIILGKGYGTWKNNSFRVANFPSISESSFDALVSFLSKRQ